MGRKGGTVTVEIVEARAREHLAVAAELFRAYWRAEPDDLCFADFERELAGLPGVYAPPHGRLLLALVDRRPGGCVGVCASANVGEAEIRRLYVVPQCRGAGLGRRLAEAALAAARELGYARVRLTTRAHMEAARALYRTLGFREVEPRPGSDEPFAMAAEFGTRAGEAA
jgi:ribosomal protein S18 acetylase RimI-like enzyme